MSESAAEVLDDGRITALIADPALITTHEIALEVLSVLEAEIANIQVQVDAATIEANIRPLTPDRQAWLRRASYAGAIRRQERHRVMQRDKELRGTKGKAVTEPKRSKEEKVLRQQRLLAETEDRRNKRVLAVERERTRQMELAQQNRELNAVKNFYYKFHQIARQRLAPDLYDAIKYAANDGSQVTGERTADAPLS